MITYGHITNWEAGKKNFTCGGSLEKLTHGVTYWRAICFLRFRVFFGPGVPGFLGGVPGFLGSVPDFSVVPECSGVPVFLEVLHAQKRPLLAGKILIL